jgi:hypothetical protein
VYYGRKIKYPVMLRMTPSSIRSKTQVRQGERPETLSSFRVSEQVMELKKELDVFFGWLEAPLGAKMSL